MGKTPGMLNPLSFNSDEEFAAALKEQGRAAGWTPWSSLEHSAIEAGEDAVEDVLEHYGVKGMKWGVRTKDRAPEVSRQDVTITQKKPGKFAKTTGGKDLPLNEDAARALELRQKAKASTTDALSNKELQTAITRMNLEQQYQNLAFQSDRRSKGQRFVQGLLGYKRYGKKRPYADPSEETGEQVRKAIEAVLESKAAAAAAAVA